MTSNFDIPMPAKFAQFLETSKKPLIVVLGHTASGKTEYSISLAQQLNSQLSILNSQFRSCEIINADSRQLYRYMNIGTAKISESEKRGVVHRLIDVLDPKEPVSISWYKEKCEAIIEDCHRRGVIPMLVGGSMLYISSIIDGLEPLPSDPELRKKLESEYELDHGQTLMQKLEELDPEGALSIDQRNKVYLVRALEIAMTTEKSLVVSKKKSVCPYDLFIFGLAQSTEERSKRITERTHAMFQQGWVEEIQNLLTQGYSKNDPGLMSTGYREIIEWLESGSKDHSELEQLIARKTRQYAKRQMTWWRHDERIHWLSGTLLD